LAYGFTKDQYDLFCHDRKDKIIAMILMRRQPIRMLQF